MQLVIIEIILLFFQVIRFVQTPGTEFMVEACSACNYDVLKIYFDEHDVTACNDAFNDVTTTGNQAMLEFTSDDG